MILALTILFACSASTPEASAPGPANAPAAPVATIDPACVAKADAADGATDGVVQKCAGCTLLMDGDPAHASTHAGATFHSCSDGCKARLDADPGAVVAKACAMR